MMKKGKENKKYLKVNGVTVSLSIHYEKLILKSMINKVV